MAAVAVLTLSVFACGGGSGDGSGGGGDTLTFLSWSGEEVMAPVVESFEAAHPDIDVETSYAPPVAEYIQALQTRVLSGTAPDVFVIAAENKTGLASALAVLFTVAVAVLSIGQLVLSRRVERNVL